jgi:hypothetical protein
MRSSLSLLAAHEENQPHEALSFISPEVVIG